MGKTVAQLEAENKALKEKLEASAPEATLVAENTELKQKLEQSKEDKAAAEERMMAEIKKMNENGVNIVDGKVEGTNIMVMTTTEYADYSKANGRVMGRAKGEKTKCTIEELRALINSNWTPSMIMDKHGLSAEDFKQLVWQLSKKELRDIPIKFDIKRDTIRKEG